MLVVILTGGTLILAGHQFVRGMVRDQIDERLILAASDRQVLMQTYVLQQLERVALVASRTRLRQLIQQYQTGAIGAEPFWRESARILLDAQKSSRGFVRIAIADRSGVVITATDRAALGKDYSDDSDVQAGRQTAHLGFPHKIDGAYRAVLTAPLAADDRGFLGIVVVLLDVDPFVAFITSRTGLGESGEVLVGTRRDDGVRLLVPPRHAPETVALPLGSMPVMERALRSETAFVRTRDYRGIDVLAAYRPVGYQDWGMVAKIDVAEAYAPLGRLRSLLIGLEVGLLAAGVVASYLLTRRSVRPVLDLAEKATAVAAGDLKVRVPVTTQDEIGRLASAFNRMTEHLAASYATLEQQTTDSARANQDLQAEIVERRQMEEALRRSERQLALVYDHVSDVVFYLGVEPGERFRFLSVNPAFVKATGLSVGQAIGKLVQEVIPEPAHALVLSSYREAIRDKKTVQWEEVSVYPAGTKYGEVAVTPIFDASGRCTNLVGTVHDVTERRQAEEQIRRLNAELEQRVIERTAQLEAANKELEAFSYSVSHDLRAPLRAMDGFSQALMEDYADRLDLRGVDHLKRVRAAAQRMAQLIDDLLSLSRVTRTEIRGEPVDLSALASSIAADLQQVHPQRRVTFRVVEGLVVNGDPRLLRVVLGNLLDNAWKFTSRQSSAAVEVGVTERDGRPVYFVRDNGVGFDMAYADRLFGAFQRLHPAAEFEGTGIGLAMVQRIVHRHGGQVWAEGTVGQGATFYFTLQAHQAAGGA